MGIRTICFVALLLTGCTKNTSTDTSGTDTSTSSTDPCAGTSYEGQAICTAWMWNTTGETAKVIESGGVYPLVNVPSAQVVTSGSTDVLEVHASGIPNYTWTPTQDDIDALNARPKASSDFASGATTAVAGTTYDYGDDIGYHSTGCVGSAGFGWWPPGPGCPTDQQKAWDLPLNPTPADASNGCYTALGPEGMWVNGVSVYNWSDGNSYASGAWYNLAMAMEVYDLGPCFGHAAHGDYHHHGFTKDGSCLAQQLGDDGSAPSAIWGYAADGYPIYGPYYDTGVLARSCWKTRDYTQAIGTVCAGGGARDCVLKPANGDNWYDHQWTAAELADPSNYAAATVDGPNTSDTVTTLSHNTITAVSGTYFEDYYYDKACKDAAPQDLDIHNGTTVDGSYRYYVTYAFPWMTGPELYGTVPSSTFARCQTDPYPRAGGAHP